MNATLALEDESGYSLVCPLKRSWAPRGQTPVVRTSIDHHQRLNLIGALLVTPDGQTAKLSLRSYWCNLSGLQVIAFLKQLLRRVPGIIVLVWDNHPIHRRKAVQEFLAGQERLVVFHFPTAAPELNPIEYVWTQVSEYCAGRAPRDRRELQRQVMAGVARTRQSQKRLQGCLTATGLEWL